MKPIFVLLLLIVASSSLAENTPVPLQIKIIEDGVYLHTSFKRVEGYGLVSSNGLVVLDGKQAFIVDTPWSKPDTEMLLNWINEQGYELKASISTHSHEDRTAGIGFLNSKLIPTYTSKLTNDLLLNEGRPTATNIFDKDEFSLKEGRVEVSYPGPGHTVDNLVVWLPKEGILFGGCLVRSLAWDGLGYIGDASIDSWAGSIERIKSKYPNIISIVPGHGEVGDIKILDHTIKLARAAANRSIQ